MSALSSTSGQSALKERRLGINPNVLMPVLWLAATVAIALPSISGGVFDAMSTDDAMRLVQVRDLISGQGWFDLFQYRLDPPAVKTADWNARRRSRGTISLAAPTACSRTCAGRRDCRANE